MVLPTRYHSHRVSVEGLRAFRLPLPSSVASVLVFTLVFEFQLTVILDNLAVLPHAVGFDTSPIKFQDSIAKVYHWLEFGIPDGMALVSDRFEVSAFKLTVLDVSPLFPPLFKTLPFVPVSVFKTKTFRGYDSRRK